MRCNDERVIGILVLEIREDLKSFIFVFVGDQPSFRVSAQYVQTGQTKVPR